MSKIYILENMQIILEKQKLKFADILDKKKKNIFLNQIL
jgi:hypothetical protein